MGVVLNPFAIPALLAGALDLVLAVLVYSARPDRAQNRLLALFLFFNAGITGVEYGVRFLFDDIPNAAGAYAIGEFSKALWAWTYLTFLATLDTPLARPLRAPVVRAAVAGVYVLAVVRLALYPRLITGNVVPYPVVGGWSFQSPDPLFGYGVYIFLLLWVYSIAVAVSAWRRARTPLVREQMGWYAVAFAGQDIVLFLWVLIVATFPPVTGSAWVYVVNAFAPALSTLLLDVFLAYGILKAQLFDVDIKIKRGLRSGTIAGAFVAAFLVVSQLVQNYTSSALGVVGGAVAAGLLLFALAPIQRAAQRVADVAMPSVHATDDYLSYRKIEVYRATVEEIAADGNVSAKDRSVLARLRAKLELDEAAAQAIERDVFTARGVA